MKNLSMPHLVQPSALEGKDDIDLGELIGTLWRGKLWIILTAFLALLLGGYYAFVKATPMYTASTVVALESRQDQVVDIESVVTGLGGDQATINTEVEVLRSRGLIEDLVLNLDLVSDPEFNERLRPDDGISLGKAVKGIKGLILGADAEKEPSDRAILDSVIDAVLRSLFVSNVRQSYVFRITAITEGSEKSAMIANRLAELYVRDQIAVKFEKTQQATVWLSDQVSKLRIELESAETELKAFGSSTDLISPEGLFALNRQLKELRERQTLFTDQIVQAQIRIDVLEAVQDSTPKKQAEVSNDTTLNSLLPEVGPEDTLAKRTFESRFDTILTRARQERTRLTSQQEAIRTSVSELSLRIEIQSSELVRLQQLQREAEANRLIYEAFLGRLKETSVQQGIQRADSRILSNAVVPMRASAPRRSLILALSLVFGSLVGAGLVLLRELSQNTYRVAEQVEKRTGYTVIGQIPSIPSRQRKNVLKYLIEKPNSAAAEAIRNLRTSILLADLDNPPQIIMSTSSVPGEGKTTQSIAMAQNLSGMGKKVLLIEGDIRRRVFSEYFDIRGKKGFLSVLSGDVSLKDSLSFNEQLQADILLGENSKINAADVFSSDKFHDFLTDLRKVYDYVIIDTPPVLAVPDARVIGQSVDAIMYTVKWDHTTHRQVQDGLKSLESVNVRVAGLVLSQINSKGMKRYGYGDSYGAYQSYYNN